MILCFTRSFPVAQLIFNEVVSEVDFIHLWSWDLINAFWGNHGWLNTDYWLRPLPHVLAFRKSFLKLSVSHFIAVSTCCSICYFCLASCENYLFFLFIFIFDFLLFNLLCKILLTIYNTKLNRLKNWYSTSLQLSLTKCYFTIPTHSALCTPYANMANHSVVVWNELYESEASWASVFCFDKLP